MTMHRSGRVVAGTLPSSSAKDGGGRRGCGSEITCAHRSPSTAHDRAATAVAAAIYSVFRVPRFGGFIGRFPQLSFRQASRDMGQVLKHIGSFDDTFARAVERPRAATHRLLVSLGLLRAANRTGRSEERRVGK